MALLYFLDVPQLPSAWQYAVRTAGGVAALLVFRPWRWYPRPQLRHVPLAIAAGVLVLVLWVAGESPWMPSGLREVYERWAVLPWGELREPVEGTPYAPSVCGWPLTVVRLLGSGLVIAVIEEFFWRGFLYRWTFGGDFTQVKPDTWDASRFILVAVVFGAEHAEWLAGVLAGLVYGALYVRTRDIWAPALAHVVTNVLLGFYVLQFGAWQFW